MRKEDEGFIFILVRSVHAGIENMCLVRCESISYYCRFFFMIA